MEIVPASVVTAAAADPAHFTGPVWQARVVGGRPDGLRGLQFTYGPGGRSNWHVHTGEQALIVVAGRGLIHWEGLDAPRDLAPGDWVLVEPGVPHWHGAAPDDALVHLAVTATGGVQWRRPVTDEEYGGLPAGEALHHGGEGVDVVHGDHGGA
jgi:quercetin dioxygenase-like cupin family protein